MEQPDPRPWTAYYERRGEDWVAWHPDHPHTGVVGHSLDEARKNLSEVLLLLERRLQLGPSAPPTLPPALAPAIISAADA